MSQEIPESMFNVMCGIAAHLMPHKKYRRVVKKAVKRGFIQRRTVFVLTDEGRKVINYFNPYVLE